MTSAPSYSAARCDPGGVYFPPARTPSSPFGTYLWDDAAEVCVRWPRVLTVRHGRIAEVTSFLSADSPGSVCRLPCIPKMRGTACGASYRAGNRLRRSGASMLSDPLAVSAAGGICEGCRGLLPRTEGHWVRRAVVDTFAAVSKYAVADDATRGFRAVAAVVPAVAASWVLGLLVAGPGRD
jgi:hypothetical protein